MLIACIFPDLVGVEALKVLKEEQCGVYEYLTHSEDLWLQVALRAGLLKSPSFSNAQHFSSAMIEWR